MKKPSETRDTPETTTGFDRVVNKERSVEETAKKFNNDMAFQLKPSNDTMKAVRLAHKMVTELLNAERQKKNEAVEAKAIEVREEEANEYNKIIEGVEVRAYKDGVRDMRDYCQEVVSKISGNLVAVFNEKARAFIEDITQPNENAPLTVVSSEDLGDKLGEQAVCPNCNQLHYVEYGTDGKSGEIIRALAFVSCEENNKAYLVGINNKEIKHGA
jgi:hypothetical protein